MFIDFLLSETEVLYQESVKIRNSQCQSQFEDEKTDRMNVTAESQCL